MLLLILAASVAQTSGYQACVARIDHAGFVKSQMLDCATKDMDRADSTLNARYQAIIGRLGSARRNRLRIEERSWIQQRHDRCLESRQDAIPSQEINRMLCLVRETDARTAVLNRRY